MNKLEQLKIGICDDEIKEIENTKELIKKWGEQREILYNLQCFTNGEKLLANIQEGNSFDILFLDIYMNGSNGLEVAKLIREFDAKCKLVFMTNSPKHAIEGYGVRAFNYHLKPINSEIINNTLDIANKERIRIQEPFIMIKNKNGNYQCLLNQIIYAESKARIITIHMETGPDIDYYDRLDNLELTFNDKRFLRCHKSFLVNLDYIQAIVNSKAILYSKVEIPISKPISEMKKVFASYMTNQL